MSEAGRREGSRRRPPAPGVARRGLLRGLAGGGALVALAAGGETHEVDVPGDAAAAANADPARIGFRATDHTRWFYRRARW